MPGAAAAMLRVRRLGGLNLVVTHRDRASAEALLSAGMLTRHADENHQQKVSYHLAQAAIDFVPVLTAIGAWGNQ